MSSEWGHNLLDVAGCRVITYQVAREGFEFFEVPWVVGYGKSTASSILRCPLIK